jgi:hypothetical protein
VESSESCIIDDIEIVQEEAQVLQSLPPETNLPEESSDSLWRDEIRHLKKRVRNVQESIQLGSEGIANPTTYQTNVLNAVENCLDEWRAILNHYMPCAHVSKERPSFEDPTLVEPDESAIHDPDLARSAALGSLLPTETTQMNPGPTQVNPEPAASGSLIIDPETIKETALLVYMLLQLALQCGPLTGSNPGYFKRCGGTVAHMVMEFLDKVVPSDQECTQVLRFSEYQANAISRWRDNATKAAVNDKPPSKSNMKKQQGKSKKKQRKKCWHAHAHVASEINSQCNRLYATYGISSLTNVASFGFGTIQSTYWGMLWRVADAQESLPCEDSCQGGVLAIKIFLMPRL